LGNRSKFRGIKKMWKNDDGSTGRLLQLCLGYFVFYIITGLTVKYFLGAAEAGFPGYTGIEYLTYSTIGGSAIAIGVVLSLGWYRMKSIRLIVWRGMSFPSEWLYLIPSGVLTAVVIPTTTLMYTLPISVMVAMVIMRGSVIVTSRVIDAIQIRQGILKKTVFPEENWGVVFALSAIGVHLLWAREGGFDFLTHPAAMTILTAYLTAYAFRIYIMNYYKNTRPKNAPYDSKGFFGVEQVAASATLVVAAVCLYFSPDWFGWTASQVLAFREAVDQPPAEWPMAILAGTAFGGAAFFSVFLFIFKGRTATFAGLVNRLTSLIAGTTSTLIFWAAFGGKFPKPQDWLSLVFILTAVYFLTRAEKRRAAELRGEAVAPTLAGRAVGTALGAMGLRKKTTTEEVAAKVAGPNA
jgi:hypothetical protein